MAFATVMVPLDLGARSLDRLKLAGGLAVRFDARLIGLAARQPLPTRLYGDEAYLSSDAIDVVYARVTDELAQVEAQFHRVAPEHHDAEFRSGRSDPMAFLTLQARAADLVVVSRYDDEDAEDWCAGIDPGELILRLGLPVLIVPPGIDALEARRVVIAGKDTREARRAVRDSLPILKEADEVLVVIVGGEAELSGAEDAVGHLSQHGISARTVAGSTSQGGIAQEILTIARREDADLIVAGAYGHSRMREMMFGSVTRRLLREAHVCCLMSH